jgi:hypothetical protein
LEIKSAGRRQDNLSAGYRAARSKEWGPSEQHETKTFHESFDKKQSAEFAKIR